MKKMIVIILLLLAGCSALDNSGKHAPIYLTDDRYAHYRNGLLSEPAPWTD